MARNLTLKSGAAAAPTSLGGGSTVFCGNGCQLYDVPGALTPIHVCCNWDTPISGNIEMDVNFSCYDCVVAVFTGATNCSSGNYFWMLPANACISSCICAGGCYSGASFLWQCQLYSGYNCQFSNVSAVPSTNGQFCNGVSTRIVYEMLPGGLSCGFCSTCTGVNMKSIAWHQTCTVRKDFNINPICTSYYEGCWPKSKVDFSELCDYDLCKVVIANSNLCLLPYTNNNSSYPIEGAMYGVWGRVKSNPDVAGKSGAYPS